MQKLIYRGKIRDGAVGTLTKDEYEVYYDSDLEYAFLEPKPVINYEDDSYRLAVNDSNDIQRYYELHHEIQGTYYHLIKNYVKPGDTVLEVGCGGGILLDRLKEESTRTIGIEPNESYQDVLRDKGHLVYRDIEKGLEDWNNKIDLVISFHVIEHVHEPVAFIQSIGKLLKPGGLAFILTPNYHDILLHLHFNAFAPFFFRRVHPLYLTASGLIKIVEASAMEFIAIEYFHEFGLSNTFYWLRDGKPKGNLPIPGLDKSMDAAWKEYLIKTGQTKDIAVVFRRPIDDK